MILFAAKIGYELPAPPAIRYLVDTGRLGVDVDEYCGRECLPTFVRDPLFYGEGEGGWVNKTLLPKEEGKQGGLGEGGRKPRGGTAGEGGQGEGAVGIWG